MLGCAKEAIKQCYMALCEPSCSANGWIFWDFSGWDANFTAQARVAISASWWLWVAPPADWWAGCVPISLGLLQLAQELFRPDIKPQFGLNWQPAIIVYYQRRTYFQLHH